MDINRIDFIVKTFKRYQCLDKLLESVYKFYPDANVLIADDNDDKEFNPYFYRIYPRAKVFRMPFDSGLSAGRNLLVKESKRPFIFLLDDDFIFTKETKLEKFANIINSSGKIGVVGGIVVEAGQDVHYEHYFELKNRVLYQKPDGDKWEIINGVKCKQTGCVLNFALFRKAMLDRFKWDDDLKIVEHSDFYLQLTRVPRWKIYFTPEVKVIHERVRDGDYIFYRKRWEQFFAMFFRKWGIKKQVDLKGNTLMLTDDNQFIKGYEPQKR